MTATEPLLGLMQALSRRGYRFVTVTPATHARVNARAANAWAQDLAGVFGWSRRFRAGLLPAELLSLAQAAGVLEAVPGGWRSRVRFSSLGEQLYVHSAFPTTAPDSVFFGPDSYRFVAAIDAHLGHRRVAVRRAVDIGCGAGPGALAIARHAPDAQVLAVDINPTALRYTAVAAAAAGARGVLPVRSDRLQQAAGEFDLIVANPPYLLDPRGRRYRHGGGASGEGLSIAILDAALERLAAGGTLLLYTGVAIFDGDDPFGQVLRDRLRGYAGEWRYRELDPDVFGEELEQPAYAEADRIAAVLLTLTAVAGNGGRDFANPAAAGT